MTGKWLTMLREREKSLRAGESPADETDKTNKAKVLSVLSVPDIASGDFSRCAGDPTDHSLNDRIDVPAKYSDALSEMKASIPKGENIARWQQATDDAAKFLEQWGHSVEMLGWTAQELFDYSAGVCGLVWEIRGGTVKILTTRTAYIENISWGEFAYYSRRVI